MYSPVAQRYLPAGRQGAAHNKMIYKVYAIKSLRDGRIYVGMTSDVDRRLSEHNSREVFSTKGFTPWTLIYVEDCGDNRNVRKKIF